MVIDVGGNAVAVKEDHSADENEIQGMHLMNQDNSSSVPPTPPPPYPGFNQSMMSYMNSSGGGLYEEDVKPQMPNYRWYSS